MFAVFERLADADFGAPGALVHTLEKLSGYTPELVSSVQRKPTAYTVWMVNRILNGLRHQGAPEAQQMFWMNLLEQASVHPLADEITKEDAQERIAFQKTRALD